ncbi:MAG: hypothetical protein M1365_01585 [Actinobacteria bacterium]|nr:hypothetical protein [Actinomycetota bacterium]
MMWLIGKIIFKKIWSNLFSLFFAISPWFVYSVALGSFYIYLLCLILIIFLSLYLIKSDKRKTGGAIFVISSALLLYSSVIFIFSYLLFICGLFIFKFIPLSKVKLSLTLVLVICLPLIILMFRNPLGLRNIISNEINFLSDPGLINGLNVFRGESEKQGFGKFSKISENKYVYLSRYMVLKFTQNIFPSTFFTSEEKLVGFSFAPPVYLGLLIPFLYGVYLALASKTLKKVLLLSLVLVIPSFLSKKIVDLNRLILFEPIIIFMIIYGLERLNDKKNKINIVILVLCSVLLITQLIVTVSDINFREYPRFKRYYENVYWQIDK